MYKIICPECGKVVNSTERCRDLDGIYSCWKCGKYITRSSTKVRPSKRDMTKTRWKDRVIEKGMIGERGKKINKFKEEINKLEKEIDWILLSKPEFNPKRRG